MNAPLRPTRRVTLLLGLWLLPLWPLLLWSLARRWPVDARLPDWSLLSWQQLAADPRLAQALLVSVVIAASVSLLATLLAMPAAWVLADRPARWWPLWLLLLSPLLLPPQAAAYGLHRLFLQIGFVDHVPAVVVVHLVPALPYAVATLSLTAHYWGRERERQARSLGASAWQAFRLITLPGWAPGLLNAFLLCFLVSWGQVLLTQLLGGGRVLTWPLLLAGYQQGGRTALVAALALVSLVPALCYLAAVQRWFRQWLPLAAARDGASHARTSGGGARDGLRG